MVWDAAVVLFLANTLIRDFITLPLCVTTRFLKYIPLGILQIDRSTMWRWSWLRIRFLRYSA